MKKLKIILFLAAVASHSLHAAVGIAKDFVPIESLEIKAFYSSSYSFIPLSEGTGLKKGLNLYSYERGYWTPKEDFSVHYVFRQTLNEYFSRFELHKAYANYTPGIFSFTFGKNSRTIGPSENSLILSKNSPPFLMLDMETAKPLKFLGQWKFEILNGWLKEKRVDLSDTKIIVFRANYSPTRIIDIGITRYSQYGGTGRPSFKLWDYPTFLFGTYENQSFSKYDTDGYFGYDFTLNLLKYFPTTDLFKIYFQQIGTDVSAPWQPEDKGDISFPLIFEMQANSYQAGLEIKKASDTFKLEFTAINDLFYIHHYYNIEGYSYKNYSLGNPYGNHLWELYFNQKHILNSIDHISYKVGFVRQPAVENTRTNYPEKANKFYLEGELSKTKGNITLAPYIRGEYSHNYDADKRPMQYDIRTANKFYIITGLSMKMRFK